MASLRMWAAAFVAALFVSGGAFAQSVTQAGPAVGGQMPVYLAGGGAGFASIMAAGKAAGGPIGTGLNEFLQQSQSPVGTGPYGAHNCAYSTYATNPAGANYFCFDANANGGGLLAFGAIGGATPLPASLWLNGAQIPLPGTVSGLPSVASNIELALEPVSFAPFVVRRDFSYGFGASPVIFYSQTAACSLASGAGDGGEQVPALGGGCWDQAPQAVYDYREWGLSSLTMNVSTTAINPATTNTNNFCLTVPCATLAHAVSQVANFRFLGNTNSAQINVPPGNVAGATIAGHFMSASGNNAEPCLFIVGAGDVTSGTPTHITSSALNGNIEVSGNACVVIKNMDFPIIGNGVGIFTQDGGSHVLLAGDVSCTGPSSGTEAQACGHAEGGAYIEATGPNPQITMQGDFAWLFTIGATPGKLTFDPGANGVLSCGTGLTLDPTGGSFLEEGQSAVYLASGWAWASNCTGITGHPVVAQNNSTFINQSGTPLPNVGSFRLLDNSIYSPNPTPAVTSCSNGSVVNTTGINPSNNSFQVAFTGLDSGCTIGFGYVLSGQEWFTNQPICSATIGGEYPAATKYVGISYVTNGVILAPSSPFGNADIVSVICSAPAQG